MFLSDELKRGSFTKYHLAHVQSLPNPVITRLVRVIHGTNCASYSKVVAEINLSAPWVTRTSLVMTIELSTLKPT